MKLIKLFFLILMLISSSIVVFAEDVQPAQVKMLLQRLDNYVVSIQMMDDKTIHVSQSFDIVSRHKDPIIPGRAKLVLYGGINPRKIRVNVGGSIKDLSASDVIEEDDNNVIYYEIWRPIAPGERLNIQVEFETDVETKGFLFKQIDLKFGEPELPIDKMVFSISLPPGKTITYSDPRLTKQGKESGTIEFTNPGKENEASLSLEYSSLPLPTLPFNGYWLWLILVVMSLVLFVIKLISKEKFNLPNTPFSDKM